MILPSEVERLRDLNSPQADALVDLCRPRVLVVTKALYAAYSNAGLAESVLSWFFTDNLGGSGLSRGDILRGRVYGVYASDSGGLDTDTTLRVTVNGTSAATLMITRADLGGDTIAFDAEFMLRFDGGEGSTINSPSKSPFTVARAILNARFGDTTTSPDSSSQAVADSWITATSVDGASVNLAKPVTVALTYEGSTGGLLTIYGGALEGM